MWRYRNPVAVTFGWGAIERLPALVGSREAVVVTFPQAAASGLEARVEALLGARVREVIRDVDPNPEVEWFRARYPSFWKRHGGAAIVAIGGGSVIDTAKILLAGTARDDFADVLRPLAAGAQPEVAKASRLVAVPTTAGTGSEVTPWATLWERDTIPRKHSLHVEEGWPEAALVDPELTLSAPQEVVRNSALDALSHALESIWNVNANPISDALAVEAARAVIETLPSLLHRPADRALRTGMSRAALTAGLAFSNTRTALAHSISYEMTLKHGLAHGLACSFTLPFVWSLAQGCDSTRDAVLARIFGADERDAPSRLEEFLRGVGVKTRFEDYGVPLDAARAMVENALEGARGRNFAGRRGLPAIA
jgi:phosphonate metabolism-associated iron-containing alcohol dehydrogenase